MFKRKLLSGMLILALLVNSSGFSVLAKELAAQVVTETSAGESGELKATASNAEKATSSNAVKASPSNADKVTTGNADLDNYTHSNEFDKYDPEEWDSYEEYLEYLNSLDGTLVNDVEKTSTLGEDNLDFIRNDEEESKSKDNTEFELVGSNKYTTATILEKISITNDTLDDLAAEVYDENKDNCDLVKVTLQCVDAPDVEVLSASLDGLSDSKNADAQADLDMYLECEPVQTKLKEGLSADHYDFFGLWLLTYTYIKDENVYSLNNSFLIDETNNIVQLEIPMDFDGRYNFSFARYLDGEVEVLTETPNADGEYAIFNEEEKILQLGIKKGWSYVADDGEFVFRYAVGWKEGDDPADFITNSKVFVQTGNSVAINLDDMEVEGVDEITNEERTEHPSVPKINMHINIEAKGDVSETDLSSVLPFEQTDIKGQKAIKKVAESDYYDFINTGILSYHYDSLAAAAHSGVYSLEETSSCLTLRIPVDTDGKENFKYTRFFDGKAETLEEEPNADGEFAMLEDGILTICINKYGNGAISWDNKEATEETKLEENKWSSYNDDDDDGNSNASVNSGKSVNSWGLSSDGKWRFYDANGKLMVNQWTSDLYFVGETGVWNVEIPERSCPEGWETAEGSFTYTSKQEFTVTLPEIYKNNVDIFDDGNYVIFRDKRLYEADKTQGIIFVIARVKNEGDLTIPYISEQLGSKYFLDEMQIIRKFDDGTSLFAFSLTNQYGIALDPVYLEERGYRTAIIKTMHN